jgi:hypothetical protein
VHVRDSSQLGVDVAVDLAPLEADRCLLPRVDALSASLSVINKSEPSDDERFALRPALDLLRS